MSRFGTSQGQRTRALSQVGAAKEDAKSVASGSKTPGKDANRKASKGDKYYTMSQNLNQTQIDLIKKELSLNNKELTPQQEKFLRLTGHKTFTFPKRKRVNENLDDEIMS